MGSRSTCRKGGLLKRQQARCANASWIDDGNCMRKVAASPSAGASQLNRPTRMLSTDLRQAGRTSGITSIRPIRRRGDRRSVPGEPPAQPGQQHRAAAAGHEVRAGVELGTTPVNFSPIASVTVRGPTAGSWVNLPTRRRRPRE
jgi:hypothetical protein